MECYYKAEFIDDYRLLGTLRAVRSGPPSLVLIDTENDVEGSPMRTNFLLPPCFSKLWRITLRLEQGVHEPSPAESLAPFHQDPSQRIAVLDLEDDLRYLLFRVGSLLEFRRRGDLEVRWDEWKDCVVMPSIHVRPHTRSDVWVSGSRLFAIYRSGPRGSYAQMELYDFSPQGRAKQNNVNGEFCGVRYLTSTGVRVQVPQNNDVLELGGGHDSLFFPTVSVVVLRCIRQ